MMNILAKFQINFFTYFYFFLACLCGYFKNTCLLFTIVIIHEMGHLLFIKLFKYQIIKVTIYPFGGITKINSPINSSINKDLLIAIGGILMQLISLIFIKNKLFRYYSLTIIFFNLLPIYPLDGNKIINLILDKFLPFKTSLKYSNIFSILVLSIFLIYNISTNNKNYLICSFLLVELFMMVKNQKYLINKFYLERYLYNFPYEQIKSEKKVDIGLLKKNTLHFFKNNDYFLHEKKILKNYFEK